MCVRAFMCVRASVLVINYFNNGVCVCVRARVYYVVSCSALKSDWQARWKV